jgi:hypothetical protein
MKLAKCNLWIEPADYRGIPTSGALRPDGTAVLDRGLALEAARRFTDIDVDLGRLLASRGNHVHLIRPGLFSFPVKQYAWSGLDLRIIERSGRELCALVGSARTLLPKPTTDDAGLPWEKVAEVLAFLPDNVVVIDHG